MEPAVGTMTEMTTEQSGVPVVDWSRLARLSEGDRDFERELIGAFLNDSARRCRDLGVLLDGEDGEAVRVTAHGLKGSAGNVGAVRMMEAARLLETSSEAVVTPAMRTLGGILFGAYDEAVILFRRYLAGLRSGEENGTESSAFSG